MMEDTLLFHSTNSFSSEFNIKEHVMAVSNDDFLNDLFREDDLGRVIRCHIHIESKLDEFISVFFKRPEYIDRLHLEFHKKIPLALACGLINDFDKPLKVFGTIRNRFAHNLSAVLGKQEVNNLYSAFSVKSKEHLNAAYEKTAQETEEKEMPQSNLRKHTPSDQFALMSVFMRGNLDDAVKQAKNLAEQA